MKKMWGSSRVKGEDKGGQPYIVGRESNGED